MSNPQWFRSSGCGNTTCVEVARVGDEVWLRDSKHPEKDHIVLTAAEWEHFRAGVQADEFTA